MQLKAAAAAIAGRLLWRQPQEGCSDRQVVAAVVGVGETRRTDGGSAWREPSPHRLQRIRVPVAHGRTTTWSLRIVVVCTDMRYRGLH